MSALVFDTLKLAEALRAADFSDVQARGLVAALSENAQDTLATKMDVAALRSDIATLRSDLQAEIATLRSDLQTEIANLRVDTAKWIIGAVAFNFLATAGLFATLFKLFAR